MGRSPISTKHIVWAPIQLPDQLAKLFLDLLGRRVKGVVQIDAGFLAVRHCQKRIIRVSLHDSTSDTIPKIRLLDAPNLYNFEAKVPYGARELGTFRNQDLCAKEQFERGRMKVIVMAVG
jgi:hypothetical protein